MQASAGLVAGGIDKAVTTLDNLKGLGIALKAAVRITAVPQAYRIWRTSP